MLVLCYGIPKSGSTLTFELVKGMLISAGHAQERLPDGLVEAGHDINFIGAILRRPRVRELTQAIGPDRIIAVKTHSGFDQRQFPWFENKIALGELQVIASYRDPRDVCLSLLGAGARARARMSKPFSMIVDLQTAIEALQGHLLNFRRWASLRGALRIEYETVAFAPDAALEVLRQRFGFDYDKDAAKKHAFEDAFTQKNKAQRRRYESELTERQAQQVATAFQSFISGVYESDGERWLSEYREQALSAAAEAQKKRV